MAVSQAPTRDIGTPDLTWAAQGVAALSSEWWETSPDLMWPQSVQTFARMRHDPQLAAVLRAYILPIQRATWSVDPSGCRDEVVSHVADDLGIGILGVDEDPGPARRRGVVWHRHLRMALGHLTYGHMPFELRYRIEQEQPGGCHLDHLGERLPHTIAEINLNRDCTVKNVVQMTQREPIPANRLTWYVIGQEGANWAGTSMLRPAYGAWLIKHEMLRVHGTSIRRFGMGVPYVEAPPGATAAQVAQAQQLASAMRAGDQSGAGLPQGFKPMLMGLTGSVPDALDYIRYLDQAMAKMALAGLIELGQTETGSRALGETFLDLFLLSLQAVADEMATTATSGQDGLPGIVADLVTQNWGEDEDVPRVICSDVGENYQATAEALATLVSAKALTPDPALEDWIRRTWRLPDIEEPPPGQAPPAPASPSGNASPGGPGVSPPAPGPPGEQPTGTPPATVAAEAAPTGLRRGLTAAEVAAGFNPTQHQANWQAMVDGLLAAFRPVIAAQRMALADQVTAAVAGGHPERLGKLDAPAGDGPSILAEAMGHAAHDAAVAVVDEAQHQGVRADLGKVRLNMAALRGVAVGRAALVGQWLSTEAGKWAMASAGGGTDPGPEVGDHLAGLGDTPLTDHLGAAITAAQNAGRQAALAAIAADNAGGTFRASEILDKSTCAPCRDHDGHVFDSLAEAQAAYPAGAFTGCLGGMRCRGTIVANWRPVDVAAMSGNWSEKLHPRDEVGRFSGDGGGGVDVPEWSPPKRGRRARTRALEDELQQAILFNGVLGSDKRVSAELAKVDKALEDGNLSKAEKHMRRVRARLTRLVNREPSMRREKGLVGPGLATSLGAQVAFAEAEPEASWKDWLHPRDWMGRWTYKGETAPPGRGGMPGRGTGTPGPGAEPLPPAAKPVTPRALPGRGGIPGRGPGTAKAEVGNAASPAQVRRVLSDDLTRGLSDDARSVLSKGNAAERSAAGMRSSTKDMAAAVPGLTEAWEHRDDPDMIFGINGRTGYLTRISLAAPGGGAKLDRDTVIRNLIHQGHRDITAGGDPKVDGLIRQAVTADLIRTWAKTSNDSDTRALAIQHAAGEEFGLGPHAHWQDEPPDVSADFAAHGQVYRDFLRAEYDATQADLKAAGISELRLHRGMAWENWLDMPHWARDSGTVDLPPLRPLSSWSVDGSRARDYASGQGPGSWGGTQGAVMSATIPADRVVAYPQTGQGALREGELVVLALDGQAQVEYTGPGPRVP